MIGLVGKPGHTFPRHDIESTRWYSTYSKQKLTSLTTHVCTQSNKAGVLSSEQS